MDLVTVAIFIVLTLAAIGAWIVFGFIRYRSYFMRVRSALITVGMDDIWKVPTDQLADIDDVIRRCYFAKEPLPVAVSRTIDLLTKR
jgi:hypothetical protein